MAAKFPKLNFGFLYEAVLDGEAGPFAAMADPSLINAAVEPSYPTADTPELAPKPEAAENAPTSTFVVPPKV